MQIKSNIQTIIPRMALAVVGFAFMLSLVCPAVSDASADEAAQASSGTSSLGVSLTPAPTMEVQPSTSGLTTATSTSQLNVTTTDIEKFSVYLSTTNGESTLVGKYPGNTQVINPVASASQLSAFSANTWGYSLATSAPTSSTLFSAVPTTNTNPVLADVIPSGNDNFYLSIGTAIDLSLPTDTYKNELTVSVIATPMWIPQAVTFGGQTLTYMQDSNMATACTNAAIGESVQLYDVRDAKETKRPYWISKLADGECWMTQNLALDLSPDITLTSEDTNLPEGTTYTPTIATFDNIATSTSEYLDYSWNFGNKVLTSPLSENYTNWESNFDSSTGTDGSTILTDVTGWEPTYVSSVANSSDLAVDVANQTYDAHYTLGNYYMFNAATANTAVTATSGEASGSICPKGWRLPTGNTGGQFYNLAVAAGADTDSYSDSDFALVKAPNYFVFGGGVGSDSTVGGAGYYGYYWLSTVYYADYAYFLYFAASGDLSAGYYDRRYSGFSVRCVAE